MRPTHHLMFAALLLTGPLMADDAATTGTLDLDALPWQTNLADPPIGDPEKAIKGGIFRDAMPGFPKTFRALGPNSNEMWANWRKGYMEAIGTVGRHPQTDNFIPGIASHWAIMPDNKTVYFRIDKNARWSDGVPITAKDFVFSFETMKKPEILDPFMNQYAEDYFQSVEAIDTHTVRVVGKNESWRVLDDLTIGPMPSHWLKIEPGWVETYNYTPPVVAGPYTIASYKTGESVTLVRNPGWWGYQSHYYKGLYNPDTIEVRVIQDTDRYIDFLGRGELDLIPIMRARQWAQEMNQPVFENGWASRKLLYVQTPDGMSGMGMNLNTPILKNRDFRIALQYMFPFEKLNSQLMFNAYFRKTSAFDGTEYENTNLQAYGFDPRKAGEHLKKAGFEKRGPDGIRVDQAGRRASFTLTYPGKTFEQHLTVIKEEYKKIGIEINLQSLEPSTYFQKVREKAVEAFQISMTGGLYPEPHQYFNSRFAAEPQTNNFWAFASPRADELIDIYRFNMDKTQRKAAMDELDLLIQQEAFYIPFWNAPYMRFAYMNWIEFPSYYFPRRTESMMDYPTFWINPAKKTEIQEAMKTGRALPADRVVDVDPHGVKPQG